ncbi:MAG: glycine C-acetyltransferase [Gemmatimonadota bacterium]|nr:glycine C-acetyltransferase [Gemmatimonadota bacterium]MDQ8167691.1 glycine C-acetyltransferase [Gemmatimonadota bacterium]MDQ8172652.1 glycine C-acetyltransferase [Gemmatimonadota bacterium]
MSLKTELQAELDALKAAGTYKRLNYLESPQGARVRMEGRGEVIVLSSNNYLGLANEPAVVQAGIHALEQYGAGTASVRFICGTFTVHRELETALARFVGTEASLSFVSAWNANEALTPTIAREGDFVVSDALNHASIIDSVRLAKSITKCTTAVYQHSDMDDLREKLRGAKDAKRKIIWTDGVFSMEGSIAKLPEILQIAREHDAIVVMDDSHATGVLGKTGRGTAEHFGVMGEVDIITSTLGKALGGAAGGFIAGPAALCDMMTQRSRPQLFSNALPPTVTASSLAAVEYTEAHPELVTKLHDNAAYFRAAIQEAGFHPLPGETPIIPIIVGETALAIKVSEMMLDRGVFVTGFGFPVVPKGEARVRCQVSAAHSKDDLDAVIAAFKDVGKLVGLLR